MPEYMDQFAPIKLFNPHVEVDEWEFANTKYTLTTDYHQVNEYMMKLEDNLTKKYSYRNVYRKLFEIIRTFNKFTFDSESDPVDMMPWKPLSHRYKGWKKEACPFPRKKLQLSFALKHSLIKKSPPNGIREYGGSPKVHTAVFGTEVEYASVHELGRLGPDGKPMVPIRAFMPPTEYIANTLLDLVKAYIGGGFDRRVLNTSAPRGKAIAARAARMG